jgi:hypothetical protein
MTTPGLVAVKLGKLRGLAAASSLTQLLTLHRTLITDSNGTFAPNP